VVGLRETRQLGAEKAEELGSSGRRQGKKKKTHARKKPVEKTVQGQVRGLITRRNKLFTTREEEKEVNSGLENSV